MPRYRLSFHLEFDHHDDPSARADVRNNVLDVSGELAALADHLNAFSDFSGGKLQRLSASQPPRLLEWYDLYLLAE